MPRSPRFTERQMVQVLQEIDAGTLTIKDAAVRFGVHRRTIEKWRTKFGGMTVDEAQRLGQLEEENRRLKHAVAELTLDVQAMRELIKKKW